MVLESPHQNLIIPSFPGGIEKPDSTRSFPFLYPYNFPQAIFLGWENAQAGQACQHPVQASSADQGPQQFLQQVGGRKSLAKMLAEPLRPSNPGALSRFLRHVPHGHDGSGNFLL